MLRIGTVTFAVWISGAGTVAIALGAGCSSTGDSPGAPGDGAALLDREDASTRGDSDLDGTVGPDGAVAETGGSDGPDEAGPDTGGDGGGSDGGDAALDAGGSDAADAALDAGGSDAADAGLDAGPTQTIFAAHSTGDASAPTSCETCMESSGCYDPAMLGGTCETVTGNATLFSGTLPDGKTCSQVFSPLTAPISESSVCLDVLQIILTSGCAAGMLLTPCLCGTADAAGCASGTVTPNGPAYDEYACDFGSTSGISTADITRGAGMANALVQCALTFMCDCFQP